MPIYAIASTFGWDAPHWGVLATPLTHDTIWPRIQGIRDLDTGDPAVMHRLPPFSCVEVGPSAGARVYALILSYIVQEEPVLFFSLCTNLWLNDHWIPYISIGYIIIIYIIRS